MVIQNYIWLTDAFIDAKLDTACVNNYGIGARNIRGVEIENGILYMYYIF